jgi:hypothetical protein
VLIVVGSRLDRDAQALVARWSSSGAALLTCEDLSQPGWRVSPGQWRNATAVVTGSAVPVRSITGVLVRRPQVFADELGHVNAEDRDYVAAEMHAFLRCFLAMLPCPVLNPPSGTCLSGPGWSPQQWIYVAAQAGAAVTGLRVNTDAAGSAPAPFEGDTLAVTVIGSRCLGTTREDLASIAGRLAAAAGVVLLTVHFQLDSDLPAFVRADPFPKLCDPSLADAVLEALSRHEL